MTTVAERQQAAYVAAQAADARVHVELQTEQMTLNLGPQHPATHGTLRIVARLDGEQVVQADVVCGYMHRGYEKLAEVRNYPQITTLINRIDWLSSFANEVPFVLAAEKLMEIEAPPRAQWIRTILFEMGRIGTMCIFLGDMGVQAGSLQSGLFPAVPSTDVAPPTSAITSPANGANIAAESSVTITGTATDTGGGVVGSVEVSLDGGTTWRRATGTANWSYTWRPGILGPTTLRSRAVDDSGNLETPGAGRAVNITQALCPCTIWDASATP